jgi:hypothetical protein
MQSCGPVCMRYTDMVPVPALCDVAVFSSAGTSRGDGCAKPRRKSTRMPHTSCCWRCGLSLRAMTEAPVQVSLPGWHQQLVRHLPVQVDYQEHPRTLQQRRPLFRQRRPLFRQRPPLFRQQAPAATTTASATGTLPPLRPPRTTTPPGAVWRRCPRPFRLATLSKALTNFDAPALGGTTLEIANVQPVQQAYSAQHGGSSEWHNSPGKFKYLLVGGHPRRGPWLILDCARTARSLSEITD